MMVRVGIGEFRLGQSPERLKAVGLGSCLAVSLYDAETRQGGLAHTLLPGARHNRTGGSPAKFVEDAISLMVAALAAKGIPERRLVAKLAGGANMFEAGFLSRVDGIGARSAQSARDVFANLGIPLLAEDVGGNRGRTVEFDLASGDLIVYCVRDETVLQL